MPGRFLENDTRSDNNKSKKAGLVFSVQRVHKALKKGRYANKVFGTAAFYMAAVLEYLVAEAIEVAGDAAHDNKKSRITPRHLKLALQFDKELCQLIEKVTISQGGVIPKIEPSLLKPPKRKDKKKNKTSQTNTSTSGNFQGEESGPA